jgi:hypothetical protein
MQNQNPKHIRQRERRRRISEHRKRKFAEFEALARSWVPEDYRSDPILANPPVKALVYFMMIDYLMSTGNVAEVNRFIDHAVTGLAEMVKMFPGNTANN